MRDHLLSLGLDEPAIKLYCTGLEIGPAAAASLARQAHLKRPSVYPLLERLQTNGLVKKITSGRKTRYEMAEPKTVGQLMQAKVNELKDLLTSLPQEIKKLPHKQGQSLTPRLQTGRGEDAFWRLVSQVRKTNNELCWIGNLEPLLEHVQGQELFQQFSAKRMSRRVTNRAITDR